MPDGGRLELETSTVHVDEDFGRTHVGVEAGDYCVLSVTDTGTGMSEETLSRIYEPFFTTSQNGEGKGLGLGLSVVYGIVKEHGGSIYVKSEEGEGCRFILRFPLESEG